jgi:hypothetical protein
VKGRKGAHFVRPDLPGRPAGSAERPAGGGAAGVVARVLRQGPGKTLTDGWVSHLAGPFLAAGWTAGDLAYAVNHAPSGAQYPYLLENVRAPAGWVRWRLAAWLRPGERDLVDGGDVAWKHARPAVSPSQAAAAAAERIRGESARIQASRAAAAAARADPAPYAAAIRRAMGWLTPRREERS